MKILHLEYDTYPLEATKKLEQKFRVESLNCQSQEELYSHLINNKYEVIFTRLGLMMDENVFELQPDLKYIVTPTTGLNHIDNALADKKNVAVISLKGEAKFLASVKSTAEHTWMLLLALIRNLLPAALSVSNETKWDRVPYLADELDSKTIGIIGFGRLGKIISKYAEAFGMTVLAHDIKEIRTDEHPGIIFCSLDNLLKKSDFVLLLISWSEENEKFMNDEKFNLMKEHSYFINTSRGELVDEKALLKHLKNGKLKGVAIDVLQNDSAWDGELKGSFDLMNYASHNTNLIITPHMGGYGKESIGKTRNFITNKFITIAQA